MNNRRMGIRDYHDALLVNTSYQKTLNLMLEKVEAVAQEMKRNQFTVLLQLVGIVLPLTEEFYRNESEKKNKGEEKKNNKEEEKEKNKGEEEEKNKGEKKEKDVKENSSEESKKQTKDTHPNPFNMCGMPYFRDCLDWTKKVECGNPELDDEASKKTKQVVQRLLLNKTRQVRKIHREILEPEVAQQLRVLREKGMVRAEMCKKEEHGGKARKLFKRGTKRSYNKMEQPKNEDEALSIESEARRDLYQDVNIDEYINLIDWNLIKEKKFAKSKLTADDLKHHWQHFIRRDDETRRYTREEELALKAHFDKQRGEPRRINQCGFDWEEEAAALNSKSSTKTRRIAFEVFQQYQKRCNTHHRKFNWSKEENAEFFSHVSQCLAEVGGVDSLLDWPQITRNYPGRSKSQLYSHWVFKRRRVATNRNDYSLAEDEVYKVGQELKMEPYHISCILIDEYSRTQGQIKKRLSGLNAFKDVGSDSKRNINKEAFAKKVREAIERTIILKRLNELENEDVAPEVDKLAITIKELIKTAPDLTDKQRTKKMSRIGRPVRAKTSMEDELRELIRPLRIIVNRRKRSNSMPGDGRTHGLILAALYRMLNGRFDPAKTPSSSLPIDDLLEAGIETENVLTYIELKKIIDSLPPERNDVLGPELDLGRCLPANLSTLTGLRGLELYSKMLQDQIDLAALPVYPDEDGNNYAQLDVEDGEQFCLQECGDQEADDLLAARMRAVFLWPAIVGELNKQDFYMTVDELNLMEC